ncbi:hypothetical protein SDC9_43322 [bioreactor metagenome]|uniref:Uncharacterized protein n=1 Tax=bioreactor metagenome TaxID=1076179 RepID=A0A644W058_9ZZZZ
MSVADPAGSDQFARQGVRGARGDSHFRESALQVALAPDVDRLQVIGLAHPLPGQPARLLKQHADLAPDHRGLARVLLPGDERLKFMQAPVGDFRVDTRALGRRRARARRILEREGRAKAHLLDQGQRVAVVLLGLAREARDEIRAEQDVGPRGADAFDQPQIRLGGVMAVHQLQDPVRP